MQVRGWLSVFILEFSNRGVSRSGSVDSEHILSSKYVVDARSVSKRGGYALEGGLVGVQPVRTSIGSTVKAVRAIMVPKSDPRVYENPHA